MNKNTQLDEHAGRAIQFFKVNDNFTILINNLTVL